MWRMIIESLIATVPTGSNCRPRGRDATLELSWTQTGGCILADTILATISPDKRNTVVSTKEGICKVGKEAWSLGKR
jgi:hypothetical protein